MTLRQVRTGDVVRRLEGHATVATALTFGPRDAQALSGAEDGLVVLWDVGACRIVHRMRGHGARVTSLAFSAEGRTALSGSIGRKVILWDLTEGEAIRIFSGHGDGVDAVGFVPRSRRVLSASARELILWRIDELGALVAWTRNNRHMD